MNRFEDSAIVLPNFNSMLIYYPGFSSTKKSDALFKKLLSDTLWKQEQIRFWGRSTLMPRLTSWHSKQNKDYVYSGVKNCSAPYTKVLRDLHQMVEKLTGLQFNSVLMNLYRDGNDSMGWHADDETSLDGQASIASLSFGAARDFQIKPKNKSRKHTNIRLASGSLLIMKSPFQDDWLHRIPRRKEVREARINLTFRKLL